MVDQELLQEFSSRVASDFLLAGSDEVGRGPLAGPVVACTASGFFSGKKEDISLLQWLKKEGVGDSKKLTPSKRKKILKTLNVPWESFESGLVYSFQCENQSIWLSVVALSPVEIDQLNIFQASLKAMELSLTNIIQHLQKNEVSCLWLVDGKFLPSSAKRLKGEAYPLVKGDQKSVMIGLASLVAKEWRDFYMEKMGVLYPGYGFEAHSGYPTPAHKEAIQRLGVTPLHRQSFSGVKEHL